VVDERHEDVEGARAYGGGSALDQQLAFGRTDFHRPESVGARHRFPPVKPIVPP